MLEYIHGSRHVRLNRRQEFVAYPSLGKLRRRPSASRLAHALTQIGVARQRPHGFKRGDFVDVGID
jgi:hypothetical protein